MADSEKPDSAIPETRAARKKILAKPKFRRRAEARKDEVLDAALELFTEKGFAATRVEDVATRAGISKGTVYLYFASKEALMEGLIERAVSPIALQALSVVEAVGVDPRVVFNSVGGLIASRFGDPKVFAVPRLIMREVGQFPHLAEIYRRQVLDKIVPAVTRLIERQVKAGRFRPVDPDFAIRSLVGPVMAHLVLAEVFGVVPEGGLQMDRFIAQHIDVLMNGLSVKPERKNG